MVLACHLVTMVTVVQPTVVVGAYLAAMFLDHLALAWIPISHGGNYPPESCFFSLSFNVSAIIYIIMVLLRYIQVSQAITIAAFSEKKTSKMRLRNKMSFVAGSAGSCGVSIVGSFQQRNYLVVHYIGAFFSFFWTIIYFIFDTYFCYSIETLQAPHFLKLLRLLVVIFCLIIIIGNVILNVYFFESCLVAFTFQEFEGPSERLYRYISTTSEWIIFFLYQIFLASFWSDFRGISLKANKITF